MGKGRREYGIDINEVGKGPPGRKEGGKEKSHSHPQACGLPRDMDFTSHLLVSLKMFRLVTDGISRAQSEPSQPREMSSYSKKRQ